ncbi:MAG: efflux RND transporter permease subunit [Opitutales bacterium]|nr:efflux RND transporter permease subunit [Opitutales bacterium]
MSDQKEKGSMSDIFIKRPVMTMLLALSALLFGIYSYSAMPVNDLPGVDYPVIQVTVSYPGADPSIMAANIASPLEQQFMQIPGIEMITSSNSFGASKIVLQFNLSKDIDAAATDVQSAIQRASGSLPSDLPSQPSFSKDNPNDMPILLLSVLSDSMTDGELYEYAFSEIAQKLSMIDGVSKVDIYAAPRAVRVEADTQKLFNMGITMSELRNALSRTTNMYGAGKLEGPSNQFTILPNTQLSKAADYEKIIVSYKDGIPIFLRDIAIVKDDLQYDTLTKSFYTRDELGVNQEAASNVVLAIRKTSTGNAITTVAAVNAKIKEINAQLPKSIKVSETYDRSKMILDNIKDVEETIVIAFILVVIVIFLFLGRIRDTLVPSIALPFSLVLTFILMKSFGFSLNNLSLMGLTMAIGFLVDDAIVFLENTVRRMEDFGESPRQATFASAREISFTIISMTLSLAAVFIPLVFMTGIVGRVFKEFSITIVAATVMSGVVSLTLTPMMCSRILQPRSKDISTKTRIERMAHYLESAFLKFYSPTLRWMLRQNFITFVVIGLCLYGTVYFASVLPKTFFPEGDSGFATGVFVASTKSSPNELGRLQKHVFGVLKSDPAIHDAIAVSGVSGFMNSNMGVVFAVLGDKQTRDPIGEVVSRINARASLIPGVVMLLHAEPTLKISTGAVSTQQGKYQFAITAMNSGELYASAGKLMMRMYEKYGTYFSSISSDMYLDNPQLNLELDREKASMLGVSADNFSSVFRDTYAKFYFYLIKSTFNQYWSILEANAGERSFIADAQSLYFAPDSYVTGGMPVSPIGSSDAASSAYNISNLVPFNSIASTSTTLSPVSVNHIDNFPSVTISFDLCEGVAIGDVMNWMAPIASDTLSDGVSGKFVGEAVTFSETIRSLVILALVAIFVMYVILGILYESYLHPVTVLIALPIAVVGGFACLYFMGYQLSVYSIIGIFMLMGIVKKNGILVVDFAIAAEQRGMSPSDAVHHACMERFRPIIMTTFAALMGMLPIALGWGKADAESRIPLGVVVVGGLVFSQIVTLYITPVVYLWIDRLQRGVFDKIPFFARGSLND